MSDASPTREVIVLIEFNGRVEGRPGLLVTIDHPERPTLLVHAPCPCGVGTCLGIVWALHATIMLPGHPIMCWGSGGKVVQADPYGPDRFKLDVSAEWLFEHDEYDPESAGRWVQTVAVPGVREWLDAHPTEDA